MRSTCKGNLNHLLTTIYAKNDNNLGKPFLLFHSFFFVSVGDYINLHFQRFFFFFLFCYSNLNVENKKPKHQERKLK